MRRVVALLPVLLAAAVSAADSKPKIYVSVDMEGISGVVHGDQVSADSREYAAVRRWMADDVNAVIAGLLAAGAGEIVVNDAHGGMRNLSPEDLRPEATLISGATKPLGMMAGIDASYAACVFVGYHAAAGSSPAILDHTISGSTVRAVRVNGIEMPELGLNAALAGSLGVPVIFLSGDAAACSQATALLGADLVTVAVKQALNRMAAALVPFAEARRRLEQGAREALLKLGQRKPYRLAPPYRFELTYHNSGQADLGEWIPGVTRSEARTLTFTATDFAQGVRLLAVLINLGANRS